MRTVRQLIAGRRQILQDLRCCRFAVHSAGGARDTRAERRLREARFCEQPRTPRRRRRRVLDLYDGGTRGGVFRPDRRRERHRRGGRLGRRGLRTARLSDERRFPAGLALGHRGDEPPQRGGGTQAGALQGVARTLRRLGRDAEARGWNERARQASDRLEAPPRTRRG